MSQGLNTQQSLVKYSTPVLVSVAGKKKDTKLQKGKSNMLDKAWREKHRTEDILNEMLPPKEYYLDNGQLWVQTVLSTPATKTEVIQLQEELDKRLQQKQARETGICPIREQLYEQCFDELIRQITIDCKQRGFLLVRVRDEFKNQLEAYKTLYESSIAYGMRKMIDSEKKKNDLQNEIMFLDKECSELETNVQELEKKIELTKINENKKLEKENEEHKQEVDKIKEYNLKLKEDLQNQLEQKK